MRKGRSAAGTPVYEASDVRESSVSESEGGRCNKSTFRHDYRVPLATLPHALNTSLGAAHVYIWRGTVQGNAMHFFSNKNTYS
jgi:hypothetical protein